MLKEKQITYKIQPDGTFTVENYTSAKAFSNFLPAVAGPFGIPLWAFYVNRGQCIASFGVSDKSRAIMEFLPANRAYQETPFRGFRTFIKTVQKGGFEFYEPFQNHLYGNRFDTRQWLHIRPWGFTIEEKNMSLGLDVQVEYFGLPSEPFAALARAVRIKNTSAAPLDLEVMDGLPVVVPYGLNDFFLKNMSRTVEAWMQAERPTPREPVALFKLRSDPYDRPEYRNFEGANFFAAFAADPRNKVLLPETIVDPDAVFGPNLDFSDPRVFLSGPSYTPPRDQMSEGKTPCAFAFMRTALAPAQSLILYSYIGQADRPAQIKGRLQQMLSPAYFERKAQENQRLIRSLVSPASTVSGSREYDLYGAQTFLDNSLRGGYPWVISESNGNGNSIFHIYSRKHGDLERDYNPFVIQPTYLSQGEGNYRDVNQNRRMYVAFEPRVKDSNIKTFLNLIQADGFNPLVMKEVKLKFSHTGRLRSKLNGIVPAANLDAVLGILKEPRSPGAILKAMDDAGAALPSAQVNSFLDAILLFAEPLPCVEHGQGGFWTDHWFYNLDLIENYLSIYPEELERLLLKNKDYTFFDNPFYVKPRAEKYVRTPDGKIRQYQAVGFDSEKSNMIKARTEDAESVRTRCGKGRVYTTTLAAKLVSLVANKYASLDPEGIGVEMEADRPDWLDSLNGLPALLGSSISGSLELIRLIEFLTESLKSLELPKSAKIAFPAEVAALVMDLKRATDRYFARKTSGRSMDFWESTHDAKEFYWEKTRTGFRGTEKRIGADKLVKILALFASKLREGTARAGDASKEIPPTYFINEVADYRVVKAKGREVIVPKAFRQHRLPAFLEGPVHAIRIEPDARRAYDIYNTVRSSELFDRKLGMYRVCASLAGESPEIGRIRVFTPGWLENQAVFLHMEYKFLLAVLKRGLPEPFFADLRTALVAFQDPKVYGRSVFENSSFIISSVFADKKMHGSGFIARLSGTTAEFLEMWLVMNIGTHPFFIDENDKLALRINPTLPEWLFTQTDNQREIALRGGAKLSLFLPKNSFAFVFLGHTLITYHNPKRLPTYGQKRALVKRVTFTDAKGKAVMIEGSVLPEPYSRAVREGMIQRLDVELG